MSPFRVLILLSLVLGAIFMGITPQPAYAATITVNTTADELNIDGDCSLREAIQAANLNIPVDACPAGEDATTDTIVIDNNLSDITLTLVGANEDANATGDFDIFNNTATQDLIINFNNSGIDANQLDRIFHIHSGADVAIEGGYLLNGQADLGGAIYNAGTLSAEMIIGFVELGNQAQQGGAIYSVGTTSLVNTEISANTAIQGGAIYIASGNLYLSGIMIYSNIATQDGGAIFNASGGNATIEGILSISDNVAVNGGGLYNQGTATLTDGFWDSNQASVAGGGIYNQGMLTIEQLYIALNTAQQGGGVFNDGGNLSLLNTTYLLENTASLNGGGLYNLGGTVTANAIIDGNTAVDGAGIYNTGSLTFDYEMNGNQASGSGGGLYNTGTVYFNNTIYLHLNSAGINGGGIYNTQIITANDLSIVVNTAGVDGGGIYNVGSIDGAFSVEGNSSGNDGGGIYNAGTFSGTGYFDSNSVTNNGGGLFNLSGTTTLNTSTFTRNQAGGNGGAVYNASNITNAVSIADSCIVNNSDTAFFNATTQIQTATGNWWGRIDGPGPVASGSGDTVSINVDTSGFQTVKPSGCSNRTTPSATITPPSNTATHTPTFTPSDTPTNTDTPSNTPTNSATFTPTDTATDTLTPSNTVTFTPSLTACVITTNPPNLMSPNHRTHTTDTTPTFRWSNVTGAQSYRLMVYTEDRSFEYKKRTFNTTYTLTSAEALVPAKYLWRVRTQDATCNTWSGWSQRNTLFVD